MTKKTKESVIRDDPDVVTEGSEESFPASDPPSYMAGSAVAGSPRGSGLDEPRKQPARRGQAARARRAR